MRTYKNNKLDQRNILSLGLTTALMLGSAWVQAHPKGEELEAVEVEDGRGKDLIGIAESASQGEISQKQFEHRPLSRQGELLEVVPGMIATQHSGSGKANQYFLRGFNLDHGTDFTTFVDGIPMNMPSHAHGQGYLDLNSIIPELVNTIEFGKGPYYAEVGDFASAGYTKMRTVDRLKDGIAKFTAGSFDFYRALAANSSKVGDGDLLYAGEFNLYNGVWEVPENTQRFNGMLKYTVDNHDWGYSIDGKAYSNRWTASNQIPQSAIDAGLIGLYGAMDPTDTGESNRYSVAGNLWQYGDNWKNTGNIYALYTDLDLFSNFSGFTRGPQGDQILQTERRVQTGGSIEHTRYNKILGFEMDNSVGLQFRNDQVMGLGLYNTRAGQILDTVSNSDVGVTTVGVYLKNHTHWHDKVRTITGLRADFLNNEVRVLESALNTAEINDGNSGNRGKVMLSPKVGLVLGPWYDSEFFVNAGYGHHSNDARGTTLRVNPDGTPAVNEVGASIARIAPAAWTRGSEVGFRTNVIPGLNSTVAAWWLQTSQELVFVGDAGTTEVRGMSDRYGLEFTNYYNPTDWLILDADYALTTARFSENGDYVPNSVGRVIGTGATLIAPNGLFGTVRLRHFGHVPLDEQGEFWAGDTSIVNLGAGYKQKTYRLDVDVFNVLGSQDSDIAYAYPYSFGGIDTGGANGLLRHPVEPRMIRGTITVNF
ncbi:MAG: TonB-dependent receptor plug domain-containing protein [Methylomonas sp.]|nr:TonB-dependent receptor plug domain-containing protein [Methylomonas sp.]PPD22666.1 MAG: TonB-dependent receptor [Methylomonas sp.]PPD27875.1 MAG: TonB-dependent receptor [Methylomonas sp.]PPD39985.1 MAG: TonB-dependent receptor [Methylomonas sp.]PPD41034.1 MAG: TonB-dependent receptor [Methylomonas sp.]